MRWRNSRSNAWKRSAPLSLLVLSLLAAHGMAQDLSGLPALKSLTSAGGPSSSDATTTDGGRTRSTDSPSSSNNRDTTTDDDSSSQTSTAKGTTVTGVGVSLTGGISISSPTSTSGSAGEAAQTGSIFHLSNLPTIAGATIPTPSVPFTGNAPFMQKSNLPEGSVFIIVGAILGFFGACVLLWRGLIAWSLARSVKRAAITQTRTFKDAKSSYASPSGMYKGGPIGSSASMERLTAIGEKSAKRKSYHPASSTQSSSLTPQQSANPLNVRASAQMLFFSPTAGAGHHSAIPSPHAAPSQRNSSAYLPAGYYASGTAQPAGGQGSALINAHAGGQRGSSILNPLSDRLSGIAAASAGYQRAQSFGHYSPPASPGLAPTPVSAMRTSASSMVGQVNGPIGGGNGLYSQPSGSSLNLSVPGGTMSGGRTPSAYLEEVFENHGNGPRERF